MSKHFKRSCVVVALVVAVVLPAALPLATLAVSSAPANSAISSGVSSTSVAESTPPASSVSASIPESTAESVPESTPAPILPAPTLANAPTPAAMSLDGGAAPVTEVASANVGTFTLTFDANGGTGTQAPIVVDVERSGQYLPPTGMHPLTITAPTGKSFVGWSLSPTGTPTYYNDPANRVDTTYHAIWGDSITITFDANGGTGTQASQSIGAGALFSPPFAGNVTLGAPSGKQFAGWSLTPDGALWMGGNLTENTTFYAIWGTPITITFDANGGAGTQAPQTSLTGGSLNLPLGSSLTLTAPEGKLFAGWALTPTGDPVSFDNTTHGQLTTGDMTLYAIWSDPVTLTFDSNGGTGTEPPITEAKGRVIYLNRIDSGLVVGPQGEALAGWSLTVDGEAISEYRVSEDTTLYAVWEGSAASNYPDIPYTPTGTLNIQGSTVPSGSSLHTVEVSEVKVAKLVNYAKTSQLQGSYAFLSDITLLDAAGNPVQPDANTLVRIDIPGLTTQDKVTVVHEKSDGSIELVPATVYNGYLTFRPTGFSVYGVLVQKNAGGGISSSSSGTTTSTGTSSAGATTALSPQTGVANLSV